MRILHVNSYDMASARFDGQQMAPLLEAAGHEFRMAVGTKMTADPRIDWLHFRGFGRLSGLIDRIEWWAGLQSVLFPTPLVLMTRPVFRRADVVHLHLIHNRFFSLLALPSLCKMKPVVWTIHDLWACTGHCNYPIDCPNWKNGCGQCPDLARPLPLRIDTTDRMWGLKQWLYRKLDVDLVVASQWMADKIAESPLLSSFRRHMIPHGVDTDVFRPMDQRAARSHLGLPQDAQVLTFRAFRCPGDFKGVEWLADALPKCRPQKKCILVALDNPLVAQELQARYAGLPQYEVRSYGWVQEQKQLVDIYNASDLFLMPSRAEAFGLMAIEAMACGLPLVVGEGTALPEVVAAPRCGLAVPYGDTEALAGAITRLLGDEGLRREMGCRGRERVEQEYSVSLCVQRHLAVYEQAVSRWKALRRRGV